MKFPFAICFLLLNTYCLIFAQKVDDTTISNATASDDYRSLAETITIAEMKDHLNIIASDEFEGRETGTEGQKKAAAYIAEQFEYMGLPTIGKNNTYFQDISFLSERWKLISLQINGKDLRHLWDYYSFPSTNTAIDEISFEDILFLGYGIDAPSYSDYKRVDVTDKILLIYAGEPFNNKGISQVTGTSSASEWSTDWRKKIKTAKEKGASFVLIIDTDFKKNMAQARKSILNNQLKIGFGEQPEQNYVNNIFISSTVANTIIGEELMKKVIKARKRMQQKGKSKGVKIKNSVKIKQEKRVRKIAGENVLGYLEGMDPKLKHELVVVTAHYDHLGKRGEDVYNGADDNGSGTTAVLEICEAFVEAKKRGIGPKRSILFMLVSGEEKGLLGSQYYVENPIFPLENTIVNINIDMVGRVDSKHAENPNYIYVIGADRLSTELHEINEQANTTYTNIELDYTYNAPNDPNRYYYRSDHYNFAERGIPAIFYFSGTHEDYHRTTDTVEKIQFNKMLNIAKLIFYTTIELANRAERIKVDVKQGQP